MDMDNIVFHILSISISCLWIFTPIYMVIDDAIDYHYVEAVEEEVSRSQPERVITGQVFKEPRLSSFLCAFIGSTIFSIEMISVNPISSMSLAWTVYAKSAGFHLLLGFTAGYMTVKMMKSMKASGKHWILVCLKVPFLSYGLFLLYCKAVRIDVGNNYIAVGAALRVCLSTPTILLGGYSATASTKCSRFPIHLVAKYPNSSLPVVTIPALIAWAAAYLVSLYGFLCLISLFAINLNDYLFERIIFLVPIPFLLVTTVYVFLGFSHAVIIRTNQSSCWWKLFFMVGIPGGISLLPFAFQWPTATWLISFVVVVVKAGTLGPLLLYFFYPLLFRKQQIQQQRRQTVTSLLLLSSSLQKAADSAAATATAIQKAADSAAVASATIQKAADSAAAAVTAIKKSSRFSSGGFLAV